MNPPRSKRYRLPDVGDREDSGSKGKAGKYMNDILNSRNRVMKIQQEFLSEAKERKRLTEAVQNMYASDMLSFGSKSMAPRMDALNTSQSVQQTMDTRYGNNGGMGGNSSMDNTMEGDATYSPSEPDPSPPDINAIRQLGQMTAGNENPYRRVLSLLSSGAVSAQGALGLSSLRAADATQQRAKHLMISAEAHRKITQIAYSAAMRITISPEIYQAQSTLLESMAGNTVGQRNEGQRQHNHSQAPTVTHEMQQNEVSFRVLMEALQLLSEICTSLGQNQTKGSSGSSQGSSGGSSGTGTGQSQEQSQQQQGAVGGTSQPKDAPQSPLNSGIQLNQLGISEQGMGGDRQGAGGIPSPVSQGLICNNSFTASETLLCCSCVIEPTSLMLTVGMPSGPGGKITGSAGRSKSGGMKQQQQQAQIPSGPQGDLSGVSAGANIGNTSVSVGSSSRLCSQVQVSISNDLQTLGNLAVQMATSNDVLSNNTQYFSVSTLCLKVLTLIMSDHLMTTPPLKSTQRGSNGKILVNDIPSCVSNAEIVKALTNAKLVVNVNRNTVGGAGRQGSNSTQPKAAEGQSNPRLGKVFKLSDACVVLLILGRMCEWGFGRRQLSTDAAYIINEKVLLGSSGSSGPKQGSLGGGGATKGSQFQYDDSATNSILDRGKCFVQDPGFKHAIFILLWFVKEARTLIACSVAGENDERFPPREMQSILVCATYVINSLVKSQLLRVRLIHLGLFEILTHLIDYSDVAVPSPAVPTFPPQLYENIAGIIARYCSSNTPVVPSPYNMSTASLVGPALMNIDEAAPGPTPQFGDLSLKNSSASYCRRRFLSSPLVGKLGSFFSVNSSTTDVDASSSKRVQFLSSCILRDISGEKEIRTAINSGSSQDQAGKANRSKTNNTGASSKSSSGLSLASGIVSLLSANAQNIQQGALQGGGIEVASFMNARFSIVSLCVPRPERVTVTSAICDVLDGVADASNATCVNPPLAELENTNRNTSEFAKAKIVDTIRNTMNICNANEDAWGPGANTIMCSCIQILTQILRVQEGRNSLKGSYLASTKGDNIPFAQQPLPSVLISTLQSTNRELVKVSAECLANACRSSEAANVVVSGCCGNSPQSSAGANSGAMCTDGIRILLSIMPQGDKRLVEAISRCITLSIANCTSACVNASGASGQAKQGTTLSPNSFVAHRIGICYGSCLEGIMTRLKAAVNDVQECVGAITGRLGDINLSLNGIGDIAGGDKIEGLDYSFFAKGGANNQNLSYNFSANYGNTSVAAGGNMININNINKVTNGIGTSTQQSGQIDTHTKALTSTYGTTAGVISAIDTIPTEYFTALDTANNLLGSVLGLISALCRDDENCKILGELGLVETLANIDFVWCLKSLKVSNSVISSIQKMNSSGEASKSPGSRNPFYVATQPIRLIMYFTALTINLMSNVNGNIDKFHGVGLDNVLLMFLASSRSDIATAQKRPAPLYSDNYPWPSLVDVARVSCTAVASLSVSSLVSFSILGNRISPNLLLKLVGSEDRETQESAAKALKNIRTHKIYESESAKRNAHM